MKHQSIACFRNVLLLLAGISVGSTALAQPPAVYRPGKTVTIEAEFDGPDIDKLTGTTVWLNLDGSPSAGQENFQQQLRVDKAAPIGPGKFDVSGVIPDNIATGTYKLFRIDTGAPDVGASFMNGLPDIRIRIENHRSFTIKFKGAKELSKP